MLQRSSVDFESLTESLTDHFEAGEDAIPGITDVAECVLRELISEQAQRPENEMADMKMLMEAVAMLHLIMSATAISISRTLTGVSKTAA